MNPGFMYIMSNHTRTTFYIGVANDLARRVMEHRQGILPGFTKRYNVKDLKYYEQATGIENAIRREKQLKNWHREWKLNLIKSVNPELRDLSDEVLGS